MSIFPKKNRRNFTRNFRGGYTLVELLIVIAVVVVLMSAAIANIGSSGKYFTFNTASEKVLQMVREARSLAVTGKAQKDYTDYNKNDDTNDLVTPAGYGINFDVGASSEVVTLFADLHASPDTLPEDTDKFEGVYNPPSAPTDIGQYEAGKDLILSTYTIDKTLKFVFSDPETTSYTIIYTPIFADIKFDPPLNANTLFIFGVSEKTGDRHKCSSIHPVAGIPEAMADSDCPT